MTAAADGAAVYDRLVGHAAYNRLAWGASPEHYARFAAEAVEATGAVDAVGAVDGADDGGAVGAVGAEVGPLLDAGCGSATFTTSAYANVARPLVLVDRSLDMLTRADARLPGGRATLVQADLMDLPFRAHRFAVVACFGVLHVLDDARAALRALRTQLASGGQLAARASATPHHGEQGHGADGEPHALERHGAVTRQGARGAR